MHVISSVKILNIKLSFGWLCDAWNQLSCALYWLLYEKVWISTCLIKKKKKKKKNIYIYAFCFCEDDSVVSQAFHMAHVKFVWFGRMTCLMWLGNPFSTWWAWCWCSWAAPSVSRIHICGLNLLTCWLLSSRHAMNPGAFLLSKSTGLLLYFVVFFFFFFCSALIIVIAGF